MFDRCIYFNLSTLTRKINKIWQLEFERIGLSPSHGYLLFAMTELPGASQKALGELVELDASTITRLIDGLEAKGYVKKVSRGKGAKFSVTPEGRKRYRSVKKVMDSLYSDMQVRFGAEHFKRFVDDLYNAKQTIEEK